MPGSDPLRNALVLLRPRLSRLLLAILCGVLSLGSALALAGVSAWLITRAWQMPPVLDLSIAVVAVRAFGISRGALHYCERLASPDTVLRAGTAARSAIYARLAHAPAGSAARLSGGDRLLIAVDTPQGCRRARRSISRPVVGLAAEESCCPLMVSCGARGCTARTNRRGCPAPSRTHAPH